MQEFITRNPALIQIIIGALIAISVYLYKKNEAKGVKLISDRITELCRAIKSLVDKDDDKGRWMSKMQAQIDARDARCDERSKLIVGISRRQDVSLANVDKAFMSRRESDMNYNNEDRED